MYSDYLIYKKRLEKTLDTLRAEYLGQNEKLLDHTPAAPNLPPEILADQIAHQLLFRLSLVTEMTDAEICDNRRWLRAAALFLLERCPEEDHIYGKLVTLANTDPETLSTLDFSGWPAHYSQELANVPRAVKVGLEAVIWMLTKPRFDLLNQLDKTVSPSHKF